MQFARRTFTLFALLLVTLLLGFVALRLLKASVASGPADFIRSHLNLATGQCPTSDHKIQFWADLTRARITYDAAFDVFSGAEEIEAVINVSDAITLNSAMGEVMLGCNDAPLCIVNGTKSSTEACDDGDTDDMNGCSNGCTVTDGWTCESGMDMHSVCTMNSVSQCSDGVDNDGDGGADLIGGMSAVTRMPGSAMQWSYGDQWGNENNYVKFIASHQGIYYFLRLGLRGTSTLQAVDYTSGRSVAELQIPSGMQVKEGQLFFYYPLFSKLDHDHDALYLGFQGGVYANEPNRIFKVELGPPMRLAGTYELPVNEWIFKVNRPATGEFNGSNYQLQRYNLEMNASGDRLYITGENRLSTAYKVLAINTADMSLATQAIPTGGSDRFGIGFVRAMIMDQVRNKLFVVNNAATVFELDPLTLAVRQSFAVSPINSLHELTAYDQETGLLFLVGKLPSAGSYKTIASLFNTVSFTKVGQTELFAGAPVTYMGTIWDYMDAKRILLFDPGAGRAYVTAIYNNRQASSPLFVNELSVTATSLSLQTQYSSFPQELAYYDRFTHVAYVDLPQSNILRSINLVTDTQIDRSRSELLNDRNEYYGMRAAAMPGGIEVTAPHTKTQQIGTLIYHVSLDPPILIHPADLQCGDLTGNE